MFSTERHGRNVNNDDIPRRKKKKVRYVVEKTYENKYNSRFAFLFVNIHENMSKYLFELLSLYMY